jgi:23S rRNA pseudouridine2605 synthase
MFEEVGHHVEKIKRVKYGPLALDVPPGKFRPLTQLEVDRLRTAAGQKVAEVSRREAAS